jgi:hypothetical protein
MKITAGGIGFEACAFGPVPPQLGSALGEFAKRHADSITADLTTLAQMDEGVEPLLISAPGRLAADAARQIQTALTPALIAAAFLDLGLSEALAQGAAVIRLQAGETACWIGPVSLALGSSDIRAPLACDLAQNVTGAAKHGVAADGKRAGRPGLCDTAAVLASTAVRAAAAAQAIADAMPLPTIVTGQPLTADVIWDGLGAGARIAQRLRSQRLIDACALTARGRGRCIGALDAHLLVRFGVSEWR